MEQNNKPVKVALDVNKNAGKKENKHPSTVGVIIGIVLLFLGLAALFGWWKLEPLFFKVSLYILATLIVSIAFFGIVEELTAKAKSNYSMAAMLVIWVASIIYASSLTDISVTRWLSLIFAGFFGFIAMVAFAVQATKDLRSKPRPTLGWITTIIVVFMFYGVLGRHFALPIILCLIPLTLIVLYIEYLRTKFLSASITEAGSAQVSDMSKTDITAPYRRLGQILIGQILRPKSFLRNLQGIRPLLYGILIVFSVIFYFIVTKEPAEKHSFTLFYEVVAAAYLGILAIVIAFAVLVIRGHTQQEVTEHFRRAIMGLVKMYVVFALITVVGLLLGTEVSGSILTRSVEFSEILGSADSFLNLCRLLVVEFAVLVFPIGLLYLYAMIKDFLGS